MKSLVLTLKLEEHLRKRKAFFRHLLCLFFYLAVFFFFVSSSYGQCEMKFEYEVVHSTQGINNGKIYLKLVQGSGPFKFNLYDKYKGGEKFEKQTDFITLKKGEKKLIFNNVSASSFWIQVENSQCKYTIGGLDGIIVEEKL